MMAGRAVQKVRDHQKASVLYHMLLYGIAALYHLTNKPNQCRSARDVVALETAIAFPLSGHKHSTFYLSLYCNAILLAPSLTLHF